MTRTLEELSQYLVGHWKFDGDFKDSSGNGNHGVPTDIEWKPTERGMKPEFNGSTSKCVIPNVGEIAFVGSEEQYTYYTIFSYNNYGIENTVISKHYYPTTPINILVDPYGRLAVRLRKDYPAYTYGVESESGFIKPNKIYCVVVTVDKTNLLLKVYVNGTYVGHDTIANVDYSNSTGLEIGYRHDGSVPHKGIITEGGYYSGTILSADEVLALYESTKQAYGVRPAERSFSHDVGSVLGTDENMVFATDMHTKNADGTLVDLSGNGNHGTVNGAVRSNGYFRNGMRFDGVDDVITSAFSQQAIGKIGSISVLFSFDDVNDVASGVFNVGQRPSVKIYNSSKLQLYWYGASGMKHINESNYHSVEPNTVHLAEFVYNYNKIWIVLNGVLVEYDDNVVLTETSETVELGSYMGKHCNCIIYNASVSDNGELPVQVASRFNSLARLPLYTCDFSKYPSNTTVYDDFLPYSSARISSGSFKVNDDKLECVTDGQIVFRNAHEFDGDEYIKLTINDTVYAGTGTITQGTTTASIEQGSTLITVDMVAGDTIDSIDIQFREPVE
jgi:hypothetical protein